MSNLDARQTSPPNNGEPSVNAFLAIFPDLHYAINRVLDDCNPAESRKVVVALWTLADSESEDSSGKYTSIRDLVNAFREWFVVSEATASSQVSKVKTDLLKCNFIRIEGGANHVHLTAKGEAVAQGMMNKVREVLGSTLGVLTTEEQEMLLGFARRLINTRKKRSRGREMLSLDLH